MNIELNQNQKLIYDLLLLNYNILNYSKQCFTDLNDKISSLIHQDFQLQLSPTLLYSIEEKLNLLEKYLQKIPQLTNFQELKVFYLKIYQFIHPDYLQIEKIILDLNTTTQQNKLPWLIVNFVLPNKLSLVINFLHTNGDWLQEIDLPAKSLTVREYLDDLPVWQLNYQILYNNIINYQRIYLKSNQSGLFYISLSKELTYKPDINLKFEYNYKNTILQSIIDAEINQSPQSFDDFQCLVLDLLEILTFHLDSFPNIINLINIFVKIFQGKVKFATSNLNITKIDYIANVDDLHVFLNEQIIPLSQDLISSGTRGLSNQARYHEIFKILLLFKQLLDNLNLTKLQNLHELDNIYYRDEIYFMEILLNYKISLDNFLKFMVQCHHDVEKIIQDKKDEFDEFDGLIKDCFFDLNYFTQRFDWEMKLVHEMDKYHDEEEVVST